MTHPPAFQHLATAEDCERLNERFRGKKVVALWATTQPRQNVDVLLALDSALRQRGIPVLFLMKENAVEFAEAHAREVHSFSLLNDSGLLRYLPCVELLVTHDYVTGYKKIPGFRGKVMYLNHTATGRPGVAMDYFADYLVDINTNFACDFDCSFVPNFLSVQHNPQLAIVPAGSIKLDLLGAERARAGKHHGQIVSFYPLSSEHMLGSNATKIDRTVREWNAFVEGFFRRFPEGKFVFSPAIADRKRDFIRHFADTWRQERHFVFSEADDNKYWVARSDFLLTDWSAIAGSWIATSLRPAIFLRPATEEPLRENAHGYIASTGEQALDALARAQKDLWRWKTRLLRLRNEQIPFFGQSVDRLCEAIRYIVSAEFPEPLPSWGVFEKNATPEKPALALLRFVSFRKRRPEALRMLAPAYIWQKVFQEIPESGCLALAALDELIAYSSCREPNELGSQKLLVYLLHAFERVPQHIIYKFLVNKLVPASPDIILMRLLCVVVSHADSTPAQREHLIETFQKTAIDPGKIPEFFPASFWPQGDAFSREVLEQIFLAWRSGPQGAASPPSTGEGETTPR